MTSTADRRPLSREEAAARAARVGDVAYALDLELTPDRYRGEVTVTAHIEGGGDTFLEFAGAKIEHFEIGGEELEPRRDGERLLLPGDRLGGEVTIRVVYENEYDHTGEGLHRFVDPEDGATYLYTGFEPYQAHRVFPCFDQPDLKATYQAAVTAPSGWDVISAGAVTATEDAGGGRVRRRFARTVPFSTYLFAIVAGPYRSVHAEHDGVPLGLYTRASLFPHMDPDELFELTARGLDFFSELFGAPYPFGKYDQLFVPEFNWGGMENVAAVTYTDTLIFRDPPTATQRLQRAEIVLHELAHMWFGNLVTMRWWDDLWLNESFATFVAHLAMEGATEMGGVWEFFNTRVKAPAYQDDQRPTTHPIAADVPTTDTVFLNFDQITYGKGASTLQQLVATIGRDAFASGLRTYFARHAFGNADLVQFLAALQEGAGRDLARWAARWLKTTSVNTLAVRMEGDGARIARLHLDQEAPAEHPTLRPHTVQVALLGEDATGLRVDAVPATIDRASALVPAASGKPRPLLVFPNHGDLTYAKVRLDDESSRFMVERLGDVDDPLLRQLLWSTAWEMVRDRALSSLDYLAMIRDHLPSEGNLEVLRATATRAVATLARYVPEQVRESESSAFVAAGRAAIDGDVDADAAVLWVRALIGAAATPADLDFVAAVVDGAGGAPGVRIDQDMRWAVAARHAAFDRPGWRARVAAEAERDPSDRGARARLAAETSAPDPAVKETAWQKIRDRGYPSLHLAAAAMTGFGWAHQADLLSPYATRFFAEVEDVVDRWEWEEARAFFARMHPGYLVDEDNLAATRELGRRAGDERLRRLAVEATDDLERALACRRLAAASLPDIGPGEDGHEAAAPPTGGTVSL